MIIWIEGTSDAEAVARRVAALEPSVRFVDVAQLGELLAESVGEAGVDFRTLPVWRRLAPVIVDAVARATGGDVLVGLSLLDDATRTVLSHGISALGHQMVGVTPDDASSEDLLDEVRRLLHPDPRSPRQTHHGLEPGSPDAEAEEPRREPQETRAVIYTVVDAQEARVGHAAPPDAENWLMHLEVPGRDDTTDFPPASRAEHVETARRLGIPRIFLFDEEHAHVHEVLPDDPV